MLPFFKLNHGDAAPGDDQHRWLERHDINNVYLEQKRRRVVTAGPGLGGDLVECGAEADGAAAELDVEHEEETFFDLTRWTAAAAAAAKAAAAAAAAAPTRRQSRCRFRRRRRCFRRRRRRFRRRRVTSLACAVMTA